MLNIKWINGISTGGDIATNKGRKKDGAQERKGNIHKDMRERSETVHQENYRGTFRDGAWRETGAWSETGYQQRYGSTVRDRAPRETEDTIRNWVAQKDTGHGPKWREHSQRVRGTITNGGTQSEIRGQGQRRHTKRLKVTDREGWRDTVRNGVWVLVLPVPFPREPQIVQVHTWLQPIQSWVADWASVLS